MHNALKSWSIPKGVPHDLGERRLAMATEDHPLEYLDFDVFLAGKKLKGDWLLIKDPAGGNKWKIQKITSAAKPLSARTKDSSALTGRTMEEIAGQAKNVRHSHRTPLPDIDLDSLPTSEMKFVQPMECKLVATLPEREGWQYEGKFDGYRALGIRTESGVSLLSRSNRSLADRFPEVVNALGSLEEGTILDGEIVALDSSGKPSFNLLQHYAGPSAALVYYVFDQLAYRRKSLLALPLEKRREALEVTLSQLADPIRLSAALNASADQVIAAVREQGLKGIIAKRCASRYQPGRRSGQWIKLKTNQGQEFVVGGYRVVNHSLDNLAIGYYEGNDLLFIAKLKNGFTPAAKSAIYDRLKKLEADKCPFTNLPEPRNAGRGEALTEAALEKYRWIKPKLVVQVEFTDWTAANHRRHSRFLGLRDDKNPRDVRKEDA